MTGECKNTDKTIWTKEGGVLDQGYLPTISVTEKGLIAINVGGTAIVLPVEEWHKLGVKMEEEYLEAQAQADADAYNDQMKAEAEYQAQCEAEAEAEYHAQCQAEDEAAHYEEPPPEEYYEEGP